MQFTSRGKIRALLQKNLLRMWRNVGVMLFIFALPVMQVILFCLAIGRDPTGLKLAIVNNEMIGEVSEKLLFQLSRVPNFVSASIRHVFTSKAASLAIYRVATWIT